MFASNLLLGLVKAVVFLYTVITLPFYYVYYKWIKTRAADAVRARVVSTGPNEITYKANPYPCRFTEEMIKHPDNLNTMERLAKFVVSKYNRRPCLGTRTLLKEETVAGPELNKPLTKLVLGDYQWLRYADLDRLSTDFARGLLEIGVQPRERVCIFADTRADWLVAAWGCWKNSIALATIYTNLGDEGIVYGVNQTQATTVITSSNLLDKLGNIIKELPEVKNVVYFEHQLESGPRSVEGREGVTTIPYSRLVALGSKSTLALSAPNPEDIAIVMYTSGSTGTPKGVLLTHANLVSALHSLIPIIAKGVESFGSLTEEDSYAAFLPLAHVLELLAEHVMLIIGLKLGYSNPGTLTDKSAMIRAGDKGDCAVLRPAGMAAVPLIVDRIYKGIQNTVNQKGEFSKRLVEYCVRYRRRWVERGYDTPLMNSLVFAKFRAIVGGRLRILVCGGAPLSEEPQSYISTCLGIPLMQGYGLTETSSTACVADAVDLLPGHVGPPLMGVHLKITDWEEGGYTVKDPQGPRGEIVIGGNHVAAGYFLMPEKTKEDFFEEGGVRYFRTGDIGQVIEGGRVKIIDRKKDLVKLQAGEYVSLGKVEANLKIHPVVENICVYADPSKNAVVALIVPDEEKLQELVCEPSVGARTRAQMCADPTVTKKVLGVITAQGKAIGLQKFEIPKAIYLVPESWTPESGLVTAAFKLKRKPIQTRYQKAIDDMYESLERPADSVGIRMNDLGESKEKEIRLNQIRPASDA